MQHGTPSVFVSRQDGLACRSGSAFRMPLHNRLVIQMVAIERPGWSTRMHRESHRFGARASIRCTLLAQPATLHPNVGVEGGGGLARLAASVVKERTCSTSTARRS